MYYCAVRCPSCLVTVYTAVLPGDKPGLTVTSLANATLLYYNCPLQICDYHVNSNHDVNLYSNIPSMHKIYPSPGFIIAPWTATTTAFRTRDQVAALAVTLGTTQVVLQKPAVKEEQVSDKSQAGDKAQSAKDPGERDGRGVTSVPAVAHPKNKNSRGVKWSGPEMEKLKRLAKDGLAHDEIAKEMERSASGVKNKIAAMRDKGQLELPYTVPGTPLKRKRHAKEEDVVHRPSSITHQGGSMDRS